ISIKKATQSKTESRYYCEFVEDDFKHSQVFLSMIHEAATGAGASALLDAKDSSTPLIPGSIWQACEGKDSKVTFCKNPNGDCLFYDHPLFTPKKKEDGLFTGGGVTSDFARLVQKSPPALPPSGLRVFPDCAGDKPEN